MKALDGAMVRTAAALRSFESIAAPTAIILPAGVITSWGDCLGMGFENKFEVQFTSLMKR